MASEPAGKGLLDTSILIDFAIIPTNQLPRVAAISSITLAELSQGPHLARDTNQRILRLEHLQEVESLFPAPLPFDAGCARIYGSLTALIIAAGRHTRPRRLDLMIAATAVMHGLPLYTRNGADFQGLESRLHVVTM